MLQSQRLYYRELEASDADGMFALDSDPEVHRYLYDAVIHDVEQSKEVIEYVRQQYKDVGLGRMAVILKETNEFIGWAGLKLESNVNGYDKFYDIGYRLMPQHWGKGYATEATHFFLDYAFTTLKAEKVNAYAFQDNGASVRVLEKCGLQRIENFMQDGIETIWFEINNPQKGLDEIS